MELLLDTANLEQIQKYVDTLPIDGVTSNPSIIKKEGKIDFFEHLRQIRQIIGKNRTLHVQVVATDYEGMLADAQRILKEVDDQVYIKVPSNEVGFKVMKELKRQGIHITATAIYTEFQGLLAIHAGADYLAPYYNRMENLNIEASLVIQNLAAEIKRVHSDSKILAASFKNVSQVLQAINQGTQAVTIGPDVVAQAFSMPSIQKAIDDFSQDWQSIYKDSYIHDLS